MLLQPLMDKLTQLHLPAFRKGIEEQITNPKYAELPFEERLSMLVDLELLQRDNSRLRRRLKRAHFHLNAVMEDFDFSSASVVIVSWRLDHQQTEYHYYRANRRRENISRLCSRSFCMQS